MGTETEYDDFTIGQHNAPQGAQVIQVETSRYAPLLIVLCVLVGLTFMGAAWAIHEAKRAQTRADVLQLEVESFKNVLHANNLPTSAHLPGESP